MFACACVSVFGGDGIFHPTLKLLSMHDHCNKEALHTLEIMSYPRGSSTGLLGSLINDCK